METLVAPQLWFAFSDLQRAFLEATQRPSESGGGRIRTYKAACAARLPTSGLPSSPIDLPPPRHSRLSRESATASSGVAFPSHPTAFRAQDANFAGAGWLRSVRLRADRLALAPGPSTIRDRIAA